jgi:hypothetical protein
MSGSDTFFHEKNEAMIQRVLYSDICRRTGGDLNEKQASRLMKTVKHYMSEVYRVKGESTPVTLMNKEVLQVVLPDYLMYMERTARGSGRSVVSDIEIGPGSGPGHQGQAQQGQLIQEHQYIEDVPRGRMDIDTAFGKLQASRQQTSVRPPEMADFRLSLQDEGPVPTDVFERIKKDREDEAIRQASGQQKFAAATDTFSRDKRRAQEESEIAFAEAERKQLEARASAAKEKQENLPMPPDMRSLFMGNTQNLERTSNIRPEAPASRQQLIIAREPSSIEYKETELNLFVYSGDRDWASDGSTETRYNFSVAFNPNNLATSLRLSPASTVKFRNIVRIELVKAIMPGESLDSMVTRTYSGSAFTYSIPYNINVLSFPYIQVRIPELDNNVFGTNLGLNAAFGVLQYDANWIYDTQNNNTRGYFAMIPKFLKCQKVYSPAPLATLQKLSFRFERPDGTLLSTVSDTLDIGHIYSSKQIAATTAFPYGYDATVENGTSSAYYFLRTKTYFNELDVTKGDRILIKNLIWSASPTGTAQRQIDELTRYLQDDAGFIVVDTGFGASIGSIALGANSQGYCNYIVVRGRFTDPTTGTVATDTLGNTADPSTPGSLSVITSFMNTTGLVFGRLLNQSHQVQIAMRVITREMDSTSIIRPDNL